MANNRRCAPAARRPAARVRGLAALYGVLVFACVTLAGYGAGRHWDAALDAGALMGLVTFGAHFWVAARRR